MEAKRKVIDLTQEDQVLTPIRTNVGAVSAEATFKKKKMNTYEIYHNRVRKTPSKPRHMYNEDTKWQADNMNAMDVYNQTPMNLVLDANQAYIRYYLYPHEIEKLSSREIVVDGEDVLLYDAGQLERLANFKWYGNVTEAIVYRDYRRETKNLAKQLNIISVESDDDNDSAIARDIFEHLMYDY